MKNFFVSVGVFLFLLLIGVLGFKTLDSRQNIGSAATTSVTHDSSEGAQKMFVFRPSEAPWLARSSGVELTFDQLSREKKYRWLQSKKSDVLMVLVYKKFVASATDPAGRIDFALSSSPAHLTSLLNRSGLTLSPDMELQFGSPLPEGVIAQVDGTPVYDSDIDKNHYLWGAYITEEFQWILTWVEKKIKDQLLVEESQKVRMNIQDYRKKYIEKDVDERVTSQAIEIFRKENNYPATPEGRVFAEKKLREKLGQKRFDYFVENYLMKLPIIVNLMPPDFKIQMGREYVPFIGPQDSELKVTIFRDASSPPSQKLVSELYQLANDYTGLYIDVRPVVSSQNIFLNLREKINHCVWTLQPDVYWEYLLDSQGSFNEKTQDKLFTVAEQRGVQSTSLQECVTSEQTQKVIDYHRDYADYLGIKSGPVVFVGGEVLVAPVPLKNVLKVINRQLGFPDAGIWSEKND